MSSESEKLYEALKIGDLSTVKSLVPSVFSVDPGGLSVAFEGGMTNLMVAIKYGHLDIVKYLLEKGASIEDNRRGVYWKGLDLLFLKWSPLMLALYYNQLEIAKFLIKEKANINHTNFDGDTPLIMAATIGNYEMIKMLVENGAHINHQNDRGVTALMNAICDDTLESKRNPEHQPCLPLVKYLVEKGAKINLQARGGQTALSIAVSYGNLEIVKYLVKKEDSSKGILSSIFSFGKFQNEPTRFDLRYKHGNTLLMVAIEHNRLVVLKFLLEDLPQTIKQKYLDAENTYGFTALAMATTEDKLYAVEMLLNHGASINYQNKFKNTALILASQINKGAAVRYLLERGANSTIRGQVNKTAYDLGNDQIKLIFARFYENRIHELRKDQQNYFSAIPKDLSDLIKNTIISQL